MMVIVLFMLILGSMIIIVYLFVGIFVSIIFLFYVECFYYVLKYNNMGNGVFVFGFVGLIIIYFVMFCYLILLN